MQESKTKTQTKHLSYHHNKEQTDLLRSTPLPLVMQVAGCQPDVYDKARWHTPKGAISITGMKFFNWSLGAGGGGAIDLVMHLFGMNFSHALSWLSGHLPALRAPQTNAHSTRLPLKMPMPWPENSSKMIDYLVKERRIASDAVEKVIQAGNLYADNHANAVFVMRKAGNIPVGAELRGTGKYLWRGMAPGSRKNLGFFSVREISFDAIILCESAIDALSCFLLNPSFWCVSTAGARSNIDWLPDLIAHKHKVYCGFDNDQTGLAMTHAIIHQYPDISPMHPLLHDWNCDLIASP